MPVDSVEYCRRRRGSACDDELALVKAAAWAWYQHGYAHEPTAATREFDLARRRRHRRPSRYKLEAAAAAAAAVANDAATGDHVSSAASSKPPSPASELSLLDPYEVDRISKQLDRLIASTGGGGGAADRRRRSPPAAGKGAAKVSGFWLWHAVGLCGSRADAAEARVLVGVRRSHLLP